MRVLILSDGKMGDLTQCRGVAQALTATDAITEHIVTPNWITALPLPSMPISAVDRQQEIFSLSSDIIVASGRRTVPYLRALKKLQKPAPFTVFLKDPRFNRDDIDFIWAPTHDGLTGGNVFSTLTSPHALDFSAAAEPAKLRFRDYGSPNVGIILGGDSKNVSWTARCAQEFSATLSALPAQSSILITTSRRTPEVLKSAVLQVCEDYNHWCWDGLGENPYQQILSYCDRLIVTGDSHNMVSEALAAAKPVHVFRPVGLHPKLTRFLDELAAGNLIEDVKSGFASNTATSVDATPEIVDAIRQRYRAYSHSQKGVGQIGG